MVREAKAGAGAVTLFICKDHGNGGASYLLPFPQWGAADAEIKVPSVENTELIGFSFRAGSRSLYSHTCYAYCQGFPPCLISTLNKYNDYFQTPILKSSTRFTKT